MKGIVNVPAPVSAEEFKAVSEKAHVHKNGEALDNLTQDVIDKSHSHDNMTALDGINEEDIDKLGRITDEFIEDVTNITHILNEGGIGDVTGPSGAVEGNVAVFDGGTGKAIKDGGAKLHSHGNKDVLDGITAEKVQRWDAGGGSGGGDGDVVGPDGAMDEHMPVFDGVTGKRLKDSGVRIFPLAKQMWIRFNSDGDFSVSSQGEEQESCTIISLGKGVLIGSGSSMYAHFDLEDAVSIGRDAKAKADHAAQIGGGTNETPDTFQFRDYRVVAGESGGHYLADVGKLAELLTEDKSSVVAAINETFGKIKGAGRLAVKEREWPAAHLDVTDGQNLAVNQVLRFSVEALTAAEITSDVLNKIVKVQQVVVHAGDLGDITYFPCSSGYEYAHDGDYAVKFNETYGYRIQCFGEGIVNSTNLTKLNRSITSATVTTLEIE